MKKWFTILSVFVLWITPLLTYAQYETDNEFITALDWMHIQWLTKYNTVNQFRPWDLLTRQEASKFFSSVLAFSTMPAGQNQTDFDCSFEDNEKFDSTLSDSIQFSCEAWLMRWYDNKFHPNQVLTKAQALAVLIRMQDWLLPEDQVPRRSNYYASAYTIWLTKEADESKINLPITRYEAALLLHRQYWAPFFEELPLDEVWEKKISEIIDQEKEKQELKDSLRSNYLRTE